MSLQNYNVEYIYESEKARRNQNPKSEQFKADQGGRPFVGVFRLLSSWRSKRKAIRKT